MYGTYTDEGKVRVEAIYEPPQVSDATSFELPDDPMNERVEALAKLMHVRVKHKCLCMKIQLRRS